MNQVHRRSCHGVLAMEWGPKCVGGLAKRPVSVRQKGRPDSRKGVAYSKTRKKAAVADIFRKRCVFCQQPRELRSRFLPCRGLDEITAQPTPKGPTQTPNPPKLA